MITPKIPDLADVIADLRRRVTNLERPAARPLPVADGGEFTAVSGLSMPSGVRKIHPLSAAVDTPTGISCDFSTGVLTITSPGLWTISFNTQASASTATLTAWLGPAGDSDGAWVKCQNTRTPNFTTTRRFTAGQQVAVWTYADAAWTTSNTNAANSDAIPGLTAYRVAK